MPPQAPTVELPKRLPLVVQPENRDETTNKDAKLINAYVEHNTQTDEYWIFKRPGLLQTAATKTGNGYGVYNWKTNIYRIQGTTLYKDDVSLGTVDGTGGVYRFSTTNIAANGKDYLVLGNAAKSYTYDGTTLAQINGVNFPGNTWTNAAVKGFAYLDGYTFVLDVAANVHGSDVMAGRNRPDLFTDVTNYIGAQIEPDAGICCAKQLVYVVALKQWSTEFFYDQQNTTASPLGAAQGPRLGYGCAAADSVQEMDGILFWLSVNRSSGLQIIMLKDLKAEIISTKPVERLLAGIDFTTVFSWILKYEGHRFYGLTFKVSNITLVYDMTDKFWAQWTDTNGNYFPIVSSTYSNTYGRILQHETNGKLYTVDATYYTDDSSQITVDIYTPNFDGGTKRRKQMMNMEFVGDQTAGSTLQVRTNDFDYDPAKWTNYRKVDMSVRKPMLSNCGTFVRRATHIRHQCNTRMRLQAVELQLDIGTL